MSLHWNAALFCSQLFFLRICLVVCHLKRTRPTDRFTRLQYAHRPVPLARYAILASKERVTKQQAETRTAIEDVRDDWGRVMFYLTGDMSRVESLAIPLISP